jgi:thioredoxin reductase (NADPH)
VTKSEDWDTLVIGAGPAGLAAATYLARYHRRVLVLDGGRARAEWIPESHNTPGFPHGIGGPALVARLREQATTFGARLQTGWVEALEATPQGFVARGAFGAAAAPTVLLATGVTDHLPPAPGLEDAIRRSLVRMCPICDGFEATGRRLAVLGDGGLAFREAAFLRTYSPHITVLLLGGGGGMAGEALLIAPEDLVFEDERVVLAAQDGAREFDHLYLALGCSAQADLAIRAGAKQDETGKLQVDSHQMTSVPGLYAAGDVVRGLNQISVGAGEAAIAATAIHNRLRDAGG